MNEVHTKPEGFHTGNGHDAGGTAQQGRNGVPAVRLIQDDQPGEVPEVFQMPPAPTRRVLGRVHKSGLAPFVFVDDFADQNE